MRHIQFTKHILPHLVALAIFWGVVVVFFNPLFFDNKSLSQHDIRQAIAVNKALNDYRSETGEEGLWAPSLFSGMPAYLVTVSWDTQVLNWIRRVFSFGLPHPVMHIYWAFLSYYILLLAFRVRPLLAIAGALAFGLSSYVIIGLGAGHNSRIGSIAYIPMVVAGIHLVFCGKRWIGFGITMLGMAFHLHQNHLQMTYYLLLIVLIYGLVQLVMVFRDKHFVSFFHNLGILTLAVVVAIGSFIGPLWSIFEYTRFSIRGPSELKYAQASEKQPDGALGLSKAYAFTYSNGIVEPMTLLIPDFYGGSSSHFLVQDTESVVYNELRKQQSDVANQLLRYTSSYWGEQPLTAPYYAGSIIVFLFVLGILCVEKKYVWWLVAVGLLGVVLSWGKNFSFFNYLMFDYFPGYNKFRSVTFAIIMPIFAMPLLGMLGLESMLKSGFNNVKRKQLLIAMSSTAGLCLLVWLFAGIGSFLKDSELQLPIWFTDALASDRRHLLRTDALRSLVFISIFAALLFFALKKKLSYRIFLWSCLALITLDLTMVDRRFFNKDNYQRKHKEAFEALAVDKEVLKDSTYYRVYNIGEPWSQEGRTSYFYNSVGGYHGAKLRRYQDFYDSCLYGETRRFIDDARQGRLAFSRYGGFNMLNIKYVIFGSGKTDFIQNPAANGNAWFVQEVERVRTPVAELRATCRIDTRRQAVLDESKFELHQFAYDSLSTVSLEEFKPAYLRYTSSGSVDGLAVFSEIFYPKGWHAFIDGKEVPILRVNYLLRALEIPAGSHRIEFRFMPAPYFVGNKIVRASSWLLLLLFMGSIGWGIRNEIASLSGTDTKT